MSDNLIEMKIDYTETAQEIENCIANGQGRSEEASIYRFRLRKLKAKIERAEAKKKE